MKLKKDELKVYYQGEIDVELDEDLMECLIKHGYECWASGMEIETGVRDLAFDKGERQREDDSQKRIQGKADIGV